jgi:hypothetical protein
VFWKACLTLLDLYLNKKKSKRNLFPPTLIHDQGLYLLKLIDRNAAREIWMLGEPVSGVMGLTKDLGR